MTFHRSNWGPLSALKLLRLMDLGLDVYGMLCWLSFFWDFNVRLNWSHQSCTLFSLTLRNWTSMPCPLPGRCWLMSYHITSYHFLLTLQTIEYGAVWFKVGIENLRIGKGRGPSFFSGCWCTEQDDLERRKRAVGSQDIVDFRYRSFPDFLLLKPS